MGLCGCVWVCVWGGWGVGGGGAGVRGQLPAGGIRASQGTFSSVKLLDDR